MKQKLEELLRNDNYEARHLPLSECQKCRNKIRLFEGRWYHVEMWGGSYHLNEGWRKCKSAIPQRCVKCGGKINYRIQDATYFDGMCQDCIEWDKKDEKIGDLTNEMKKKIETQTGSYHEKYGYIYSVVITRHGIFFIDIA